MNNSIKIIAAVHPFATKKVEAFLPEGSSVAEIIDATGVSSKYLENCNVVIFNPLSNDDPIVIKKEHWHLVKPKPGMMVNVRVVPTGGGGGGKNILRVVLTIAVIAAAFYFGGPLGTALLGKGTFAAATTASIGAAIISTVGNLLINALIPPPRPKLSNLSGTFSQGSGQLQITGASNQSNPFGVVPRVFGRHRVFPILAAKQFVETESDGTQYLRAIFDFGYGRLNLSDFKIGDTPLASYTGVETQVLEGQPGDGPLTLYSNSVDITGHATKLTYNTLFTTNTGSLSNEVFVDFYFSQGLVNINTSSGAYENDTVDIQVEYRVAGSGGAWTSQTFSYTDNRANPIRKSQRILIDAVSPKFYEIRVTRLTPDNTITSIYNDVYISSVRTLEYKHPINVTGRCLVAMRIKATDQLQGMIDQFNAIAESYYPVWDGSGWNNIISRHPAWAYLEVLRGDANPNPIADSRIGLDAFKAWADATPNDTFDAVIDFETTLFELLRDIANASKADFAMRDGQYSILRDIQQTTPVQHFTPRNSFGFRGSKVFKKIPHGLKVRFTNPDKGWQQDEIIVYDEGYSELNATRFEGIELFGITDPELAWRRGKYYLAVAKYRPEMYKLSTDIDHLVCTPGDLVKVVNDVPSFGGKSARIKTLTMAGADCTGVVLDDVFTFEFGTNYTSRIRLQDGTSILANINNSSNTTNILTFIPALTGANVPDVGDLIIIGKVAQEAKNLLVKSIAHSGDFKAELTLVDEGSAIYTSDTGVAPIFDNSTNIDATYAIPTLASLNLTEVTRFVNTMPVPTVVVSWTPSNDSLVLGYEVYQLIQGVYQLKTVVYNALQYTLTESGFIGDTYTVKVIPIGARGQKQLIGDAMSATLTLVGDTIIPADIYTFLTEQRQDGLRRFIWTYFSTQNDLAGVRLRANPGDNDSWEQGQPLHSGLIIESPFETDALRSGVWTVMIKAVDTSGNESENPAIIVLNLGDPIVENLVETIDYSLSTWSGLTLTNCTASVPKISADSTPGTLMWTDDGNNMWFGDALLMYDTTYLGMQVDDTFQFIVNGLMIVEYEGIGNALIEYKRRYIELQYPGLDSAPMWTDDLGNMWVINTIYLPYVSPVQVFKNEDYDIRVSISGGSVQGEISKLILKVDAPDITETFSDVAISAIGTRIVTAQALDIMKSVQITIQDDGGNARTARVYDKDPVLGALVYCFDSSNTAVTGLVDATIQGYVT